MEDVEADIDRQEPSDQHVVEQCCYDNQDQNFELKYNRDGD